jgi:hypothetical protein
MKPSPTDITPLPRQWSNLLPLTGLTRAQIQTICTLAQQRRPPAPGRPGHSPCRSGCWLVPIHPRTNLTTRALATLFHTSPSTVDRIIDHLVPILARALQPNPDGHDRPWIVDRTLIPVRDQSISAISKNYRRSVNTQIIIGAASAVCW